MVEAQKEVAAQPQASTTQYEHAGFGVRLLAAIIDGILLGIVFGVINGVFGTALGVGSSFMNPENLSDEAAAGFLFAMLGGSLLLTFINTVLSWAYYVIMTGAKGATIGKMIMKLEVVDENYQKISYGRAALREIIGKFVSSLVFCLGFLWIIFDDKKQGWHDKIAKTYVVKKS